jgi:hypothetical protein
MSDTIIETIPKESEDLDLHVQLCAQRYAQLMTRLDHVGVRLDKIELMILDIKESIKGEAKDNTDKYLKWGGAVIFVLATALVGLVTKLIAH